MNDDGKEICDNCGGTGKIPGYARGICVAKCKQKTTIVNIFSKEKCPGCKYEDELQEITYVCQICRGEGKIHWIDKMFRSEDDWW